MRARKHTPHDRRQKGRRAAKRKLLAAAHRQAGAFDAWDVPETGTLSILCLG